MAFQIEFRNGILFIKRLQEALQTAHEQLQAMTSRTLSIGIDASYVLMDSWFTQQPLIKAIVE